MSTVSNMAAQGTEGIVGVIQNLGTQAQVIGGAVAVVAMVIAGVMLMTGAFSGGMRRGLGIVAGILLGCIVLGGGAAVAPMLTSFGHDTTSGQTHTQQTGSVN